MADYYFFSIFVRFFPARAGSYNEHAHARKKPKAHNLNTEKHIFTKRHILFIAFFLLLCSALPSWAVTAAYYSTLNDKSGTTLVSAITAISHGKYSGVMYGSGNCTSCVWGAYATSDVYPSSSPYAGKIWEIYAGCTNFEYYTNQGSSCSVVCGTKSDGSGCGYNREHSLPKSWFGITSSDLGTSYRGPGVDIHHIYPTDVNVNTKRSNNPYGEVASPEYTSPNGSKKGNCTWPSGFTGTVFEPADEYKGDLARAYMYMVVTWNAYNTSTYSFTQDADGNGAVTFNNDITASGHFGLTDFGLELLLTWHRNDPVSQKEIDRNNAVEAVQGNRNPFIDYPCLVEYIWGDKAGQTFSTDDVEGSFESTFVPGSSDGCTCSTDPAIKSPRGTIDMGTTNTTTPVTRQVTLTGINLTTGNLTLSITGTNAAYFSVSPTSVSRDNALAGTTITITYTPQANGSHTAVLNISGCGLSSTHTVALTGTCATMHSVTWMADGSSYHSEMVVSGETPNLPTPPDDCSSTRKFVGWTTNSSYIHATTAPSDLFDTGAPVVTGDITFYAVYADQTDNGTSTATFDASDISNTPLTATRTWTHTASGIILYLSAGSHYTSNTPYTFSVTVGSEYYAELSSPTEMTRVVATVTGTNYKIDAVDENWSISTSGTTQTITSSGSKSLQMYASDSYQIRLLTLTITYKNYSYSNYSVACNNSASEVTATFMNGNATYVTYTGNPGSSLSVADPTSCESGYTFVGWSTHQYAATNTTAPVIDFSDAYPAADATYYAVYSRYEGDGTIIYTDNYARITSVDDLTDGNYMVVANNSGSYYALKNTTKATYYMAATAVTPSDNVISSPDASLVWQTTVSGTTVTFYNTAVSQYLYVYNNNTYYNLLLTSGTTNTGFIASVSNGQWTLTNATYTSRMIIYNSSYTEFTTATSSSVPIYLYKQQTETSGTTYYTTVNNCQCTVTAESSNEAQGTTGVRSL